MSNPEKSDPKLGFLVHQHLISLGLETPTVDVALGRSNRSKIEVIQKNVKEILETLGLDLTDDSLVDTPSRVAKMYVNEIFSGLNYDNFPKCTAIQNKMSPGKEFILERNITVNSACEHHLVTISGFAHVAYIPDKKVLGLSKLNRIVQFFAKRPQVQERLTRQIAETLKFITGSDSVAVYMDAEHYCVKSRGVEDTNSRTVTLAVKGLFETDQSIRSEFLAISRDHNG